MSPSESSTSAPTAWPVLQIVCSGSLRNGLLGKVESDQGSRHELHLGLDGIGHEQIVSMKIDGSLGELLHLPVATRVVQVGMGVEYQIDIGEGQPHLGQGWLEHFARGVLDAGIYQGDPIPLEEIEEDISASVEGGHDGVE